MRRPIRAAAIVLFALLTACIRPDADDATADVPRTADPVARGFSEADFPRVQEIAPDVYTYEALRSAGDERFTTVSMFVVTDDGVLVADGQGNPTETAGLVEAVRAVTDQPITHVVICSDHGDHTGGNSAFPAGAEFLAHPTSAAALAAAASNPDRSPDAPPVVRPTRLVADREVLRLGSTTIEVRFLGRAHTGGDLVVHLPEERVLFMSEAFLNRIFPAMRSAYPSEWVGMVRAAQAMDVDVYVPGHGFVESPAILEQELDAFRAALETVIAEGRRLHDAGTPLEQARTDARFGPLETWSLRSSQGPRAIEQVYRQLNGELPPM